MPPLLHSEAASPLVKAVTKALLRRQGSSSANATSPEPAAADGPRTERNGIPRTVAPAYALPQPAAQQTHPLAGRTGDQEERLRASPTRLDRSPPDTAAEPSGSDVAQASIDATDSTAPAEPHAAEVESAEPKASEPRTAEAKATPEKSPQPEPATKPAAAPAAARSPMDAFEMLVAQKAQASATDTKENPVATPGASRRRPGKPPATTEDDKSGQTTAGSDDADRSLRRWFNPKPDPNPPAPPTELPSD